MAIVKWEFKNKIGWQLKGKFFCFLKRNFRKYKGCH